MKTLVVAAAFGFLLASSASATVSYSTSGVFNCSDQNFVDSINSQSDTISGCLVGGSNSVTLNDQAGDEAITLVFAGIANTLNASSGTVAPYGSITASCLGLGCVTDAKSIGVPLSLLSMTVGITETSPDGSSASAGTAGITGPIAFDSSSLTIGPYSSSPVTIIGTDKVIYTMDLSDVLNSPNANSVGGAGVTGLQMKITDSNVVSGTVPEPATTAMMGVGLLALGLISRRKRT